MAEAAAGGAADAVGPVALEGGRLPCAAYVVDAATSALVGRVQGARGWPGAAARGGLGAAATALAGTATPALLILDLDGSADPLAELAALARHCEPETRVLTLGSANDVMLFRDLLALGVEDYLPKPVTEAALTAALDRLSSVAPTRREAAPVRRAPGRLVAVLGARGGVGATQLAANLAWLTAETGRRRTILVDLDLNFGTTALLFDAEPGRGLAEALANPERVDDLFLQRAAVRLTDRLSLLCAEEGPDRRAAPGSQGVAPMVERLRTGFEEIVVDAPRSCLADLPPLGPEDRLILVTDYTLVALRDTVRLLRHVRAGRHSAPVAIVAAAVGAPGRGEVTRAELERAMEAKVTLEVPFDAKGCVASAQAGAPLIRHAARSRAAAAYRLLAQRLGPEAPPAAPLWRRLLGRQG